MPLGKNKIGKMMKAGLALVGHSGVTGHALRRLFITTLANDPGVSIEESMMASRHNSVAAQRPYIRVDGHSEAARFKALGLKRKEIG